MKYLLLALIAMIPVSAVAEDKSDGCGLGWQVTNKTSFLGTTTRGTTNAFVPPTFGMTSGTIGCSQHSFAKKEQPAVIYVVSNYEPLTLQMAEGRGEYLEGLARSMGCNDASQAQFGRVMQSSFKRLVGSKTGAVELFEGVKASVHADPILAVGCSV